MPWITDRFPQYETALRGLVEQHRELEDEPLHLALAYLPATRDRQDVFLLEVINGLGDSINPDRELFEVTFGSAAEFPMGPNEQLHLILTNPRELELALRDGWASAQEIVNAIRVGDYKKLHADEVGERILLTLQDQAQRLEPVHG